MSDRCETCDAYAALSDTHGRCRAKAPTAVVVGMNQGKVAGLNGQKMLMPIVATVYPETPSGDWCREFVENQDLPHLSKEEAA